MNVTEACREIKSSKKLAKFLEVKATVFVFLFFKSVRFVSFFDAQALRCHLLIVRKEQEEKVTKNM